VALDEVDTALFGSNSRRAPTAPVVLPPMFDEDDETPEVTEEIVVDAGPLEPRRPPRGRRVAFATAASLALLVVAGIRSPPSASAARVTLDRIERRSPGAPP
jgi:hypothetical protein